MFWWDRWLWELGFAICHQLPERLLAFGDRVLFVCSRDTGLFVSFFSLILVLSLLRGRERAGMPPLAILVVAAAGILFLAWDGLTSYLGLRETTNTLRFLTGFAAGAGLAFPVAALLNGTVFGGDRALKVASRARDILAAGLSGGAVLLLYLWRPQPLFRLGQLWLLVCMLGTFWVLNLLVVYLVREMEGGGLTPARAAVAGLLTVVELTGSYWLHRGFSGSGPDVIVWLRRFSHPWR
ncbi:MAG: DUF2085 domain-containing protein [Actinobacteria bacterium]|nr:DUF2085 domain-containing protein [Actinomycetota bacterium]